MADPWKHSSLSSAAVRWWRDWQRSRCNVFDLKDCSPGEISRIASFLRVSPGELRCIGNYYPDRAHLLQRRLGTLGLDPGELERMGPEILGKLERLCATCDSRGRCALDLARDFAGGAHWADYCPNATTLNSLSTIRCRTIDASAAAQ
jgi:hypothetical protein